jgi:hypothetical protein
MRWTRWPCLSCSPSLHLSPPLSPALFTCPINTIIYLVYLVGDACHNPSVLTNILLFLCSSILHGLADDIIFLAPAVKPILWGHPPPNTVACLQEQIYIGPTRSLLVEKMQDSTLQVAAQQVGACALCALVYTHARTHTYTRMSLEILTRRCMCMCMVCVCACDTNTATHPFGSALRLLCANAKRADYRAQVSNLLPKPNS